MKSLRLALSLAAALAIPAAWSQTSYASAVKPIHAGVLLLDGNVNGGGNVVNPAPFVWYNLDRNGAVKPAGWDISNPKASALATTEMSTRWATFGQTVTAGTRLTKSEAGYWEVRASSLSVSDVAQFDVLYANVSNNLSLSPKEREALRAFVDGGGVLWIDVSQAATLDLINGFPTGFKTSNVGSGTLKVDPFATVATSPFALGARELSSAMSQSTGIISPVLPADLVNGGGTDISLLNQTVGYDYGAEAKTVAYDSSGTIITVSRHGAGFIVVSTRGIGASLNQVLVGSSYDPNVGFYADAPAFDRSSSAAAEFAVNVASLSASHSSSQNDSRQSNSIGTDLGAPLLKTFSSPIGYNVQNYSQYAPAIYKGLIVVSVNDRTSGLSHLEVYNAKPGADLDGTGPGDKGIADFKLGNPQDLIWKSQDMPGPISAPTCFEVSNPASGVPVDQIVVDAADGYIYAYDAFDLDLSGHIIGDTAATPKYQIQPTTGGTIQTPSYTQLGSGPFAPTFQEGLLFVVDTQVAGSIPAGRVWVVNPAQGAVVTDAAGQQFVVGGSANPSIPAPSGSVTVGYIPVQDNSGGYDRVVYVPTRPTGTSAAGLTSLWFGVRGEAPISVTNTGGNLQITTRSQPRVADLNISTTPADPLGFKLSVIDGNGRPYAQNSPLISQFSGTYSNAGVGVVNVPFSGVLAATDNLRVDYTLDWGNPTITNAILRGSLTFPDNSQFGRRILGSMPLAPNGTLFATVSSQQKANPGGDLYAISEQGYGKFKLIYRFSAYDAHQITESGGFITYGETFADTDGMINYAAGLQGSITNLTFASAPAVRGSDVFVTLVGDKTTGTGTIPVSVVLALKENPEPVEIHVGGLQDNFQIIQPDLTSSDDRINPKLSVQVLANQYSYVKDSTGTNGVITIDNLMSSDRGPISNALSLSQPIIIRQAGLTDTLIEPSQNGIWNPIEWYAVLEGFDSPATPKATGSTLLISGASQLDGVLNGTTPAMVGASYGFNIDVPSTDGTNLIQDPRGRSWMVQAPLVVSTTAFATSPYLKWPSFAGASSGASMANQIGFLLRRLPQAEVPGTTNLWAVGAGEGTLATIGSSASGSELAAFQLADFLVADEGRVARFDGSGDALYTSESTLGTGLVADVSNVGDVSKLVRPVRAYGISNTEMLVVDQGANRVVRMGNNGRENRSITGFIVDPVHPVAGYDAGEPSQLSGPKDATMYTEYVLAANNTFTSPNAYEYWVHYLIADAGNRRLVDLVDRYVSDSSGNVLAPIQLGVLNWHSVIYNGASGVATLNGKNWTYDSVSRLVDPSSGLAIYAAGIGSAPSAGSTDLANPATSDAEENTGNGGVLLLRQGQSSIVISKAAIPAQPANILFDSTGTLNSIARSARYHRFAGVQSVNIRAYYNSVAARISYAVMIADASGVYEIVPSDPTDLTKDWNVQWMLTNEAYQAMRGLSVPVTTTIGTPDASNPLTLRAAYARRLSSGDVLIVNSYYGTLKDLSTNFSGEVVVVDGTIDATNSDANFGFGFGKQNLGFGNASFRFQLPPIHGARTLQIPVFADKQ